jgi:hypothetical protein
MTPKEQEFYSALQDVFVGAKVEGESGYINLMRIKSRYFQEKVFPNLQQDIEATLDKYPDFRNELFDRLYDFFHRYFSESGSIYFRRTRYPQSVYEQVYTDDKDVMLFWKTRMLYYVKTDRLFKSLEVELDGHTPSTSSGRRFFFDVSTLQHKQANEKRDLVYRFDQVRADGTIVFQVEYSSHGSKTKMLEILKALRGEGVDVDEDVLQRAFRVFEKQSEVDYFINKDAEKFLKEQFDLWMYQYLFDGENVWLQRRIEQLQALKRIAFSVIDFIAQFEDELVRVWNKPKFVRDSHYVITLNRIAERNAELLTRLLAHEGMMAQVAEWRELGMVGDDFELGDVWADDYAGEQLDDACQYLPLDTRHVPDLEMEIVGLFEHLDEALDGWLIKSENYQALNTLRSRFREQVKCIYIDPPYNTTGPSEILYVNRYKDSSWLTLMENRLSISKSLLSDLSVIVIAVDDYEMVHLSEIVDQLFDKHERNMVIVNHHPQGSGGINISRTHEYALFLTPLNEAILKGKRVDDDIEYRPFMRSGTGENNFRYGRPNSFYAVLVDPQTYEVKGIEAPPEKGEDYPTDPTKEGLSRVYPIGGDGSERVWRLSYEGETVHEAVADGRIICRESGTVYQVIEHEDRRAPLYSNWVSKRYNAGTYGTNLIDDLFGSSRLFSYPKSLYTVLDSVETVTYKDKEAIILDFFAGSGTTAQAVMNLNREDGGRRKYILVEMADYFDDVLLPRVKKVAFSDSWKDGQAQAGGQGMSHFVKYYALEQYEDVLRKATYVEDAVPFDNPYQDPYQQYVFFRDLKMLHALEVDHEANEVHVDLSRLYPDIDRAETLANLRGKWIARITPEFVEFEDGERIELQDLDWQLIKPLIWW